MRRIALAVILASLAAAEHIKSATARRSCDCPIVRVSCPDTVRSGEVATFTASILSSDDLKLTYNWTASAGTIQSGQGTPSIEVDTTGLRNQSVEATVEVGGLPASCTKTASCTTPVVFIIAEDRFDEYGNIRFDDEKARLDNFAIELQNDPTAQGYIIAYGGRVGRRGEALKRAERAKGYLNDVRGISPQQVSIIDGGYREDLTLALKIRGRGMPPPEPSPTVDPKDVRFITPAPETGARRHRLAHRARSKRRKSAG